MKRLGRIVLASILAVVGLTAPAGSEETVKHTGTIISIAGDATAFVLAEVGPWQERYGEALVTELPIRLTPATEFALVKRGATPPSGFPGDFVETRIGPQEVRLGDYVTVVCRLDGGRLLALKITVNEMP